MYKVANYDKDEIVKNRDLTSSIGKMRSVIIDHKTDKVLCYSPPKSVLLETFMKKYPDFQSNTNDFCVEEFVEGTMINLFFNPSGNKWEISTKTSVGGSYSFFNQTTTFRKMFFETLENYIDGDGEEYNSTYYDTLDNWFGGLFNKSFCYSFVLQHPENRIVTQFETAKLYLIKVYHVADEKYIFNMIDKYEPSIKGLKLKFETPEKIQASSYEELIYSFSKFGSKKTPYTVMGVSITNKKTGERTKIRNPAFERVRRLRGNQSNIKYQYLVLKKEANVKKFLKYFSEYTNRFLECRDNLNKFTTNLYLSYISCFIHKKTSHSDYAYPYKGHLYDLHQYYLTVLKPHKLYVNFNETVNYVNKLHPSQQMMCMNNSAKSVFHLKSIPSKKDDCVVDNDLSEEEYYFLCEREREKERERDELYDEMYNDDDERECTDII
jgi:hypothetical protein